MKSKPLLKNLFLIVMAATTLYACQDKPSEDMQQTEASFPQIKVDYPGTKKVEHIDNYHGTEVSDPYRWLEIDTAADVEEWVKVQNKVTFGYLEQIPFRKKIEERLTELVNYPRLSSPFSAGDYYFFNKNDGLQNQSVIYFQKGLDGEPEVFIDPNELSADGTVAISINGFSPDFKYLSYSRQDAGSDWQKIKVMEVATKKELPDVVDWVKFSGASWDANGFFYSRYPEPGQGSELSGSNKFHAVYYHKLGTPQSEDKLIYENRDNPALLHFSGVTEDRKFLILSATPGTAGNDVRFKDLATGGDFKYIVEGYENNSSVIHHYDGKLLMLTDIDAPKYRLVEIDVNNPAQENWRDVIPESEDLLQSVNTGGGKLFANYLKDATDRFYQMEYDGSNQKEIELPGLGSAGGFGGRETDKVLFYSFVSFTYPNSIFKYDIETGATELFFKSDLKFDPKDFVEKQVFYTSKDGTKIPMFIVHKANLKLTGDHPTYLYAYGGFNISLTPSFSATRLVLLENDGVFAMANLRGGGEYGEEWHEAGMLQNKQNVFDDFIAGAEYLIKEGYTNSDKLAIAGGSNGGLLVGAVMTQRPDLFAVALPAVGVMDMLRYHEFTIGRAWAVEYGSSEDPEHFKNLLSYSPLHNLKEGVAYPATMVTTADHDDRVVPAHSFKFAAQLQESHAGDNPVLIRISTDAGHGAGKPIAKIIEEQADVWSFMFYNTNAPVKYLEN